jgi:hypothetical protein
VSDRKPKTRTRVYELRTYDVWGNSTDGYYVNDSYSVGEIRIRCRVKTYNAGMPNEFVDYTPTTRQLALAVGEKGLVWSGEPDYTLYADTDNGMPFCELVFEGFVDGQE